MYHPALTRSIVGLLALLASLLALSPGYAGAKKGKKYALLVGVNEYKHAGFSPLKYTENDVEELATLLHSKASSFDEVRVLSNRRGKKNKKDAPTAANILEAIDALVHKKERHDTILIGLSGHGVQLEVADPDGKGKVKTYPYFCPLDADLLGVSYLTGRSKSLVLLDDLFAKLARCGATNRLVLIDACRNEVKAESSTRNVYIEQVSVPKGVGVLFSCKSGEKAWETDKLGKGHGVFFYHVLEGLRGKAKNDYSEVTWDSLGAYVRAGVSKETPKLLGRGAEQTPHGILNLDSLPVLAVIANDLANSGILPAPLKTVANSIGMKLVRIPAGTFRMGSSKRQQDELIEHYRRTNHKSASDTVTGWYRAQGPAHEVQISRAFYMGAYEVTQAEYAKVMGSNPSHFCKDGEGRGKVVKEGDTDSFPVENVSHAEALVFCKKLSLRPGEKGKRTYRLPTEAEWEYACRGGEATPRFFHFGDSLSSVQANFDGTFPFGEAKKHLYLDRTCKVGLHNPNGFGLYDMHGNVWEWCADWYASDTYERSSRRPNPSGPTTGETRVIRGGSWFNSSRDCCSANRFMKVPTFRHNTIGFRVVMVVADESP